MRLIRDGRKRKGGGGGGGWGAGTSEELVRVLRKRPSARVGVPRSAVWLWNCGIPTHLTPACRAVLQQPTDGYDWLVSNLQPCRVHVSNTKRACRPNTHTKKIQTPPHQTNKKQQQKTTTTKNTSGGGGTLPPPLTFLLVLNEPHSSWGR